MCKPLMLSDLFTSLLLEISPPTSSEWNNLTPDAAFETAVHSPLDRQDIQILWIEYLLYQRSKVLKRDRSSSVQGQSMDELVNRCLMSLSTSSSLPHSSSAVWQDYRFHNQVSYNKIDLTTASMNRGWVPVLSWGYHPWQPAPRLNKAPMAGTAAQHSHEPLLKRKQTGICHTENVISAEGTTRRGEKLAERNLVTSLNHVEDVEDYQPTADH